MRAVPGDFILCCLWGREVEGVKLGEADLHRANLMSVSGLTCKQLESAQNWEGSYRSKDMQCDTEIPIPKKLKSLE